MSEKLIILVTRHQNVGTLRSYIGTDDESKKSTVTVVGPSKYQKQPQQLSSSSSSSSSSAIYHQPRQSILSATPTFHWSFQLLDLEL